MPETVSEEVTFDLTSDEEKVIEVKVIKTAFEGHEILTAIEKIDANITAMEEQVQIAKDFYKNITEHAKARAEELEVQRHKVMDEFVENNPPGEADGIEAC